MITGALFVGSQDDCRKFVRNVSGFYIYILRRPDGRPFYVGKGKGFGIRCLDHESEARHPNDWRSNAYKLNVIRSIWRAGDMVGYEIDFVSADEAITYARETELIAGLKRLHEGGPLTNLHPGGGSTAGASPVSKEKHSATLGGIPDDNPERAALNAFVLGIGKMNSVVIKPLSQFVPRPTQPWPSRTIGASLRTAVALVASAAANGISMDGACELPRRVTVNAVHGLVENGVACAVLMSGAGSVIPSQNPADERFQLTEMQSRNVVGWVGLRKCVDLGVLTGV